MLIAREGNEDVSERSLENVDISFRWSSLSRGYTIICSQSMTEASRYPALCLHIEERLWEFNVPCVPRITTKSLWTCPRSKREGIIHQEGSKR